MQLIQDLQIDTSSETPLFKQIAGEIKQGIASNRIRPDDHLPTVRSLARSLGINPGTVSRAYLQLVQEKIVMSRRGGGTVVLARADNPSVSQLSQRRLSNLVSNNILEILSLGYKPEEIEAEYLLHLSRWREERRSSSDGLDVQNQKTAGGPSTIVFVGSHDLAFHLLVDKLKNEHPEIKVEINYAGSLGGLIALQEGRASLVGIHLLDEETGEYNYPYIKRILPGRKLAAVHLANRMQGLMFPAGNPSKVAGLGDLRRKDLRFINRQRGSGTRVLLDLKARHLGILPDEIRGYEDEVDTHLAVALAVKHGKADTGLGIQAAAKSCGLDFLPLFSERYDLLMTKESYESRLFAPFLELVTREEFRNVVDQVGGYDTSQTGLTTFFG